MFCVRLLPLVFVRFRICLLFFVALRRIRIKNKWVNKTKGKVSNMQGGGARGYRRDRCDASLSRSTPTLFPPPPFQHAYMPPTTRVIDAANPSPPPPPPPPPTRSLCGDVHSAKKPRRAAWYPFCACTVLCRPFANAAKRLRGDGHAACSARMCAGGTSSSRDDDTNSTGTLAGTLRTRCRLSHSSDTSSGCAARQHRRAARSAPRAHARSARLRRPRGCGCAGGARLRSASSTTRCTVSATRSGTDVNEFSSTTPATGTAVRGSATAASATAPPSDAPSTNRRAGSTPAEPSSARKRRAAQASARMLSSQGGHGELPRYPL
eukprot:Rhum_TRINITY_DN15441_c3_g2::Rhum_TRINITY_DN15441_c3_g2_i10::g.154928::m.154928